MKKLALTIPGLSGSIERVNGFPNLKPELSAADLAFVVSQAFRIIIMVGGGVMIFWLSWGIFQYIFSGGKKEDLAKARSRIIYALVGFLLLLISLALQQFLEGILPHQIEGGVTPISTPALIQ